MASNLPEKGIDETVAGTAILMVKVKMTRKTCKRLIIYTPTKQKRRAFQVYDIKQRFI